VVGTVWRLSWEDQLDSNSEIQKVETGKMSTHRLCFVTGLLGSGRFANKPSAPIGIKHTGARYGRTLLNPEREVFPVLASRLLIEKAGTLGSPSGPLCAGYVTGEKKWGHKKPVGLPLGSIRFVRFFFLCFYLQNQFTATVLFV